MKEKLVIVDTKGRITLPKEVRDQIAITPGDQLQVRVVGNRIIMEKIDNPFEILKKILKKVKFDVTRRSKVEELALKEAKRRAGKLLS